MPYGAGLNILVRVFQCRGGGGSRVPPILDNPDPKVINFLDELGYSFVFPEKVMKHVITYNVF